MALGRGSGSDLPGLIRTGQPLFQQLVQKMFGSIQGEREDAFWGAGTGESSLENTKVINRFQSLREVMMSAQVLSC